MTLLCSDGPGALNSDHVPGKGPRERFHLARGFEFQTVGRAVHEAGIIGKR